MAITNKVKLRVIELRAEGMSFANIAKELGIAKQTAVDVAKDNIESVSTLQAVEMEAVFEESRINKKGRLDQLSALQKKLRDEIEQRDLTDVPTDKLITLFLKTSDTIKNEVVVPDLKDFKSLDEQEHAKRLRTPFTSWE